MFLASSPAAEAEVMVVKSSLVLSVPPSAAAAIEPAIVTGIAAAASVRARWDAL